MNRRPDGKLDAGKETAMPAPPGRWSSRWWSFAAVGLIVASAALLRAASLSQQPTFCDEDAYAAGVHSALAEHGHLASLAYASHAMKPPLLMWLCRLVLPITGNIVETGRAIAVFAGVATTVLCFFLGRIAAGRLCGVLTAALYAFSPLSVLHERMFLHDPLMATCFQGAILLAWMAGRSQEWKWLVPAAILSAAAIHLKQSGVLLAAILPAAVLLGSPAAFGRRTLLFGGLLAVTSILAYVPLCTGRLGAAISREEVRIAFLKYWRCNLAVLTDAVHVYLTWPLVAAAAAGFVIMLIRPQSRRLGILLSVVVASVSAPWLLVSNFAPSRYYLPALPFVLAAASYLLTLALKAGFRRSLPLGAFAILLTLLVTVPVARNAGAVAWSFDTAAMPEIDDLQYRSDWPSGVGYARAGELLRTLAEPGSRIGYMIYAYHTFEAGVHVAPPPGVESLGRIRHGRTDFPNDRPLYLMVDDDASHSPGRAPHPAAKLQKRFPQSTVLAEFPKPRHGLKTCLMLIPPAGTKTPLAARAPARPPYGGPEPEVHHAAPRLKTLEHALHLGRWALFFSLLGTAWRLRRAGWQRASRVFRWAGAAATFILVSISVFSTVPRPLEIQFKPDSVEYADSAHHLATGNGYVTTVHGNLPQPPRYPPGYPLCLAPFGLLGEYPANVQFGATFWAWVYLAAVTFTAAYLGGPVAAGLAALFVGSAPFLDLAAKVILSDAVAAALTLLLLPLAVRPGRAKAALAGALVGFSATVRIIMVLNAIAALVVVPRRQWPWLAAGALPFVLALGLYQWNAFGSPLKTGYDYWLPGQRQFRLLNSVATPPVMGDGPWVVSDALDGAAIEWAAPASRCGPQSSLPNVAFYPAALLGLFWCFAPALVGSVGLVYMLRRWRRRAVLAGLAIIGVNLIAFSFYFYQATRFMAAPASILVVYAAVAIGGVSRPSAIRPARRDLRREQSEEYRRDPWLAQNSGSRDLRLDGGHDGGNVAAPRRQSAAIH